MCELISAPDNRIILVALEGLENILKVGEKEAKDTGINEYAALVEECRGIDKLEQLQNHQHNEIYEKAVNILELYFAAEEEEPPTNILPQVNPGTGTYTFGNQNPGSNFNF